MVKSCGFAGPDPPPAHPASTRPPPSRHSRTVSPTRAGTRSLDRRTSHAVPLVTLGHRLTCLTLGRRVAGAAYGQEAAYRFGPVVPFGAGAGGRPAGPFPAGQPRPPPGRP